MGDECLAAPCDANAACTNTVGGFECTCDAGYTGDGVTCTDVDECLAAPCDANAACTNTEGGFECTCDAGYTGDGATCTQVTFCAAGICGSGSVCCEASCGACGGSGCGRRPGGASQCCAGSIRR